MLIFDLRYVSFADPAKMRVAVSTLNVIAAVYFLDRCQTPRTAVELISPVDRPLFEVHVSTLSAGMPLLTAFETHFICTIGAHAPLFAATGLFDCRITLWSRTPLQISVLCHL